MWRPERPGDRPTEDQARELQALDRALAGDDLAGEDAPLARLALAVRDDRTPLRPGFAEELDARVAAGFPRGSAGGPRRARARRRPETRHWLAGLGVAATLAVAAVVVAGQAGSGVRGEVTLKSPGPVASPSAAGAPGSGVPAQAVPAAPATPVPAPTSGAGDARAVQRDAQLALTAPRGHVQQIADRAIGVTDRLGGVVESSNVALDDQGSSQASLELRVPGASLDRALAQLSALGHVSSRTQSALDITGATATAGDRLTEARAERQALLRALARASNPNQVASIHARLGLLAGRIAQDQSLLQALLARGRFAHLGVTIGEGPTTAGAGSEWGPGAALADALTVLEAVFGVLVVALAALVPAALLGSLAWWGARPLRRRRREAALSSS